jgi:hypothetical protein
VVGEGRGDVVGDPDVVDARVLEAAPHQHEEIQLGRNRERQRQFENRAEEPVVFEDRGKRGRLAEQGGEEALLLGTAREGGGEEIEVPRLEPRPATGGNGIHGMASRP